MTASQFRCLAPIAPLEFSFWLPLMPLAIYEKTKKPRQLIVWGTTLGRGGNALAMVFGILSMQLVRTSRCGLRCDGRHR